MFELIGSCIVVGLVFVVLGICAFSPIIFEWAEEKGLAKRR